MLAGQPFVEFVDPGGLDVSAAPFGAPQGRAPEVREDVFAREEARLRGQQLLQAFHVDTVVARGRVEALLVEALVRREGRVGPTDGGKPVGRVVDERGDDRDVAAFGGEFAAEADAVAPDGVPGEA